jgi:hypothetical protein
VIGKGVPKVPLTFKTVNYIFTKALTDVGQLHGSRAETWSAEISALADISAHKTVTLAFYFDAVALSVPTDPSNQSIVVPSRAI